MLDGQADAHVLLHALQHDDVFIHRRLVPVEVFDVVLKAALVQEDVLLLLRVLLTLIDERDLQPAVQVRQLAQAAAYRLGIEFRLLKDRVVRQERDARAVAAGSAHALECRHRAARGDLLLLGIVIALKAHAVMAAAGAAVHDQPLGERVDYRRAYAVQAAGIIVVLVIELAAGMQLGVDHLHARDAQLRMDIHRHAASIVLDGGAAVLVQLHTDAPGIAVGHLVNRVVHDLPEQVVQAAGARRADVHARTHPDRIEPLEHLEHAGRIRFRHE